MFHPIPGKRTPNFVCDDCGHMFHFSLTPTKIRLLKILGKKGTLKCPKCGSSNLGGLCL